eukprot:1161568-Pelagomonas_calceolata.AAC.4
MPGTSKAWYLDFLSGNPNGSACQRACLPKHNARAPISWHSVPISWHLTRAQSILRCTGKKMEQHNA